MRVCVCVCIRMGRGLCVQTEDASHEDYYLRRRATSAVWTVSPFEQEITSNVFGQAELI